METKINIAEILKDKPLGTKLWTDMFGEVTLSDVDRVFDVFQVKHHGRETSFKKDGSICKEGTLCIYPSKLMRDWSKFAWKKGDVLVNKDRDVHIIFERFADDTYCSFVGKYYLWKENNDTEHFYKNERLLTSDFQKAGKDAAQTYISTIEERLGGKLNRETLEIEKTQPEFKDGDIVAVDLDRKNIRIFKEKKNENNICFGKYYIGFSFNNEGKLIQTFKNYTADCSSDRLATDSEKQQLLDALAEEGKAWDAEKKAIVDLPKKCEFKPMDWCLMRDIRGEECFAWSLCQFAYQLESGRYEAVGGMRFDECIPYNESTKHLLGTTDEWKGGEG